MEFGIPCREILNGELSLKNGDKVLIQPSSARIFDTSTRNDVIRGEWKLDNPKFIAPQVEIIPEPALPVAAPGKTAAQPEAEQTFWQKAYISTNTFVTFVLSLIQPVWW